MEKPLEWMYASWATLNTDLKPRPGGQPAEVISVLTCHRTKVL
jgi:hypothetical protein